MVLSVSPPVIVIDIDRGDVHVKADFKCQGHADQNKFRPNLAFPDRD